MMILIIKYFFGLFLCRGDLWELESSTQHLAHLAATHQRGFRDDFAAVTEIINMQTI